MSLCKMIYVTCKFIFDLININENSDFLKFIKFGVIFIGVLYIKLFN